MTRTVYRIRDVYGETIAEHVKVTLPGGGKRMYWRVPGMSPEDGLCGLSTPDLPLYGSEDVGRWSTGETVVVTEGEGATDALRALGIKALGTVTGASSTPGEDALAILLPFDVVLWPDFDPSGEKHIERVAAKTVRLGGSVRMAGRGRDRGDDAADAQSRAAVERMIAGARPWLVKTVEPPPVRLVRPTYRDNDDRVQAARSHLLDVVTARIGPPKAWRQGTPWWCCPFHAEKSPSFKVDMREPFYRCFGCEARGDVFTFLEALEGVEFKDAIRELAPPRELGGIPRMWA